MPETTQSQYEVAVARRIEQAEARVIKAVFPSITNHHNTLFGGEASLDG